MKSGDTSKNSSRKNYLKGPKLANLSDDMRHMNHNFEALGLQENSLSMTFQNPVFVTQNSGQNTPSRSNHLRRSSFIKISFHI